MYRSILLVFLALLSFRSYSQNWLGKTKKQVEKEVTTMQVGFYYENRTDGEVVLVSGEIGDDNSRMFAVFTNGVCTIHGWRAIPISKLDEFIKGYTEGYGPYKKDEGSYVFKDTINGRKVLVSLIPQKNKKFFGIVLSYDSL